MADIVIKQEEKKEPEKAETEDIKETLQKADEYEKLKAENDKLEAELLRKKEIEAKLALGGRAAAGNVDKPQEEKDKEDAARILSTYQ